VIFQKSFKGRKFCAANSKKPVAKCPVETRASAENFSGGNGKKRLKMVKNTEK